MEKRLILTREAWKKTSMVVAEPPMVELSAGRVILERAEADS